MLRVNSVISKINNLSKPAKAALMFMIASFFQQGLHIITTPIFTRILSTSDYGIVSIYNSWLSMISVVATLSLSAGVFNIGMLEYKHDRLGFASSMLILSNVATVFTAIFFIIFKDKFVCVFELPSSLILLLFLTLMLSPAMNFWIARQRYEYKYKITVFVTVILAVLSTVFSVIAVLNASSNFAEVRLWSSGVVALSFSLFFYISTLVKGKRAIVFDYWKFAISFNLPLLLHYLAFNVLSGSDRVMIANLVSTGAAGIYGLVYTASTVGNIVWNSINGSLIPFMHERMRSRKYEDINKTAKSSLIIYAAFCLIIALFAPEIIKILAPREYYDGIFVFPPVMAGIFFIALYNVFANIEFYYKKTVSIMVASVVAASINVVLNYLFIPEYGYIAAAYTTLFSYILLALMHYLNLCRVQEVKIYDLSFFAKISLVVVIFSLMTNLLYIYIVIRYSVIIVLIVVFAVFNERIIGIMSPSRYN